MGYSPRDLKESDMTEATEHAYTRGCKGSVCVCVCVCTCYMYRKRLEGRYKYTNVLNLAIFVVGIIGGFCFLLKALFIFEYTRIFFPNNLC